MNYTERIHMLMVQAGLPPRWNQTTERDLVALLQEAVRDATDEVRKAHSKEVLAHIETKKELEDACRTRAQKWEQAKQANARAESWKEENECLTAHARAMEVRIEKIEGEFREVARALELVREALPPMVPPPGAEHYPPLHERVRQVVVNLADMTACRDAAVKRADDTWAKLQEKQSQNCSTCFTVTELTAAREQTRKKLVEIREALGDYGRGDDALLTRVQQVMLDFRLTRAEVIRLTTGWERSEDRAVRLEKKIAGFREVLSAFKHLLEDL